MKVEKIKIEKEIIDLETGREYYHEIFVPSLCSTFKEEETPENNDINAQRITYEVREVWLNEKFKNRYLVRIDFNGMFNDLLQISVDDFNREVANRTQELKDSINSKLEMTKRGIIMDIKYLPFWKRLFNIF